MSEENVEIARQSYAEFSAVWSGPNPRAAIRAWLERFVDPAIEWELEPTAPGARRVYHGIDEVMEWWDQILDVFEYVRQVPERFIDCGEQVVVFVRTEAAARTTGLELNDERVHVVTYRDRKGIRLQQFRERTDALE